MGTFCSTSSVAAITPSLVEQPALINPSMADVKLHPIADNHQLLINEMPGVVFKGVVAATSSAIINIGKETGLAPIVAPSLFAIQPDGMNVIHRHQSPELGRVYASAYPFPVCSSVRDHPCRMRFARIQEKISSPGRAYKQRMALTRP